VRLNPKHPPGRVNRKARAFEPEIARLRSEGYTCEAIRAALADIGLNVSLSTVQREAARRSKQQSSLVASETSPVSSAELPSTSVSVDRGASKSAGGSRTGKQIAADFVSMRITNPLLRERSSHEGRSH
jgi:hypothetical protein